MIVIADKFGIQLQFLLNMVLAALIRMTINSLIIFFFWTGTSLRSISEKLRLV